MAYHLRRDEAGWRWTLVDDDNKVLAIAPRTWPTKGECNAAIAELQRILSTAAVAIVDTTVPGSRGRGIDMTSGEIQDGPAPESEETHDEGETGPPEVDLTTPKDAA